MKKLTFAEARKAVENQTIFRFSIEGATNELVLARLLEPEISLSGHATALAYSVTECGLSAFPTAIDLETDPYLGTNGKWTGGAFPEILPGLEQIEKDALLPGVSLRKNKPL